MVTAELPQDNVILEIEVAGSGWGDMDISRKQGDYLSATDIKQLVPLLSCNATKVREKRLFPTWHAGRWSWLIPRGRVPLFMIKSAPYTGSLYNVKEVFFQHCLTAGLNKHPMSEKILTYTGCRSCSTIEGLYVWVGLPRSITIFSGPLQSRFLHLDSENSLIASLKLISVCLPISCGMHS